MNKLNDRIFELINNLALKNRVLDNVMLFSSKYLPFLMALTICAVYIAGILTHNESSRKSSVSAGLLVAVNLAINFLIGCFVYVPRPFVTHKVNLLFPHAIDSSFPSDHATATMSMAAGMARVNRILGVLFMELSLLVGFSRIYAGHHYPIDILGSYLIVLLTDGLYRKFLEDKAEGLYARIEGRLVSVFLKKN